ncbi:uncharacterized protein LOC127092215 [Lathyrus oleraceus]|uniref:uncharacterized protein LOC127092215 n=1 Tax=Pisum sativum TaxID=3888 RepID=UPI0021D214B5|nr:uncharacterized protein LOC127092215 [Pisum sativum]
MGVVGVLIQNGQVVAYAYRQFKEELTMRQRIWLEFLKDYDFGLSYHPGKASVVVDALSKKLLHMSMPMVRELELIKQFKYLSLLRKHILDLSHVIQVRDVQVRENLTIEASPLRVYDRKVKHLRGKEIALMKVVLGGPSGESMTWELEGEVRESYLTLFPFSDLYDFIWITENICVLDSLEKVKGMIGIS